MLELKHYYVVLLNLFVQLNRISLLTFLMLPDGKLGKILELVLIPGLQVVQDGLLSDCTKGNN